METDPIKIPLEAELSQFKRDISNLSNEIDKSLSRTSGAAKRNPQLMTINNSLRAARNSTEELMSKLEEMGKNQYVVNPEYQKLATNFDKASDSVNKYKAQLGAVNSTINDLNQKANTLRETLRGGFDTKGRQLYMPTEEYNEVLSSIEFMNNELKEAEVNQKAVQDAFDSNKAVKGYNSLEDSIRKVVERYDELIKKHGALTAEQEQSRNWEVATLMKQQKVYEDEYNTQKAMLDTANLRLEETESGLNEAKEEQQQLVESGKAWTNTLTEAGQNIQNQLDSTEAKLETQEQKRDTAVEQLKEEEAELGNINQQMSEIESRGEVVVDVRTTEDYRETKSRLEASLAKEKQIQLRQEQLVSGAREWGRVVQRFVVSALAMALSYILKMRSAINQGIINAFKTIGKTIVNNVLGALKQIPSVVLNIKKEMFQLAGVITSKVGSAVVGLLSKFKNLFSLIGSGIMNIARGIGGKVSSLFSSFTSSLMSAFDVSGTIEELADDYTQNIVSARDEMQKKLDDYTAKVEERGIDLKVNPQVASNIDMLKNKVKELDTQLQYTGNTMQQFGNKSAMTTFRNMVGQINELRASLQQLRYSWSAAFAPIVSLVIPYLQMFVNWLLRVVNAIAQVIGALTGHKTYLTAVKQGVGGVTSGTKKDTKATKDNTKAKKDNNKELDKQLSGLDKLNVLHADENKDLEDQADLLDDLGDLDDLGGGGGGLGSLFEEKPIEDKFKKIADWLREMWEKGDFYELGALAGQKLKEFLDSIPWDKIQDFAARLGSSIATFLNGFLEVQGLAESVGRTIGEIVNTIQIFLTNFVDKFHFESLGKFIGDALMESFRTIDWGAIGHIFAAGLNGLFAIVDSFLKAFDPNLVSDSISEMVNRAFTDFNWSYTATIIGRFFRKLFDTISGTLDKIHFEDLGKGITAFLGNKSMWDSLFMGLTDTLNSAFDALQRFMDGFDGVKIAKQIADSINKGFANFSWRENGKTVGNFLYGLVDTITSFIEDIDFVQIINGIGDALEELRWQAIADRITQFIKNLKLGDIAKTLSDRIKNDIKWEEIGSTFADRLNTIFEKAKEFGENFDGKGILERLASAINKAVDEFDWETNGEALGNFIKGAIDALLDEIELWLDKIEENIDWDKVDKLVSRVIDRVVDFLVHAIKLVDLSKVKNTIKSVIMAKLRLDWPEIVSKLLGGAVILNLLTNAGKKMGGSVVSGMLSKLGGTALGKGFTAPFKELATNSAVTSAASGLGTALGGLLVGALLGAVAGALTIGLADILAKQLGYENGIADVAKENQKAVDDLTKSIENGVIPATEEMNKVARMNNYGDSAGAGRQMDEFRKKIIETHSDLSALTGALDENNVKVRGNGLAWKDNTTALIQINEGLGILETNGNDVNGMLSILASKYGEVDNATYKFFDHLRDGDEAYVAVQNAMRESGALADITASTISQSNDTILHSSQTVEDWYASQGKSQEYYDSLVNSVSTASDKIVEKSERLNIELDKVPTSVKAAIQQADQEAQWATQSLADNMDRLPTSVKSAIERANQESQWATQSLADNLDRLPTSVKEAIQKADSEFTTANMPNGHNFGPNVQTMLDTGLSTENLASQTRQAVTAMDNEFTTANMPNAQTFGTNVANEITVPQETMIATGNASISALDSTFTTANMPNANSLGTNISEGLKTGLLGGIATIVGAITPGLQGIITAVKTIFQVHSPSVVMQNIGRDIVQGLINGWTQNIGNFVSQISNFGTQFVSAFNNVKSRVLGVVSSMVSSVRSALSSLASMISSVISQISSAVSSVSSQVSNMASNAYRSVSSRITIPRHATGQVIPPSMSEYLAILGDNNKETEVVSPLSTMKQAMIEALGEMNMYGMGGGNSGDIVIQIDGREVFRAVQTQNNQYRKQTGSSAFA